MTFQDNSEQVETISGRPGEPHEPLEFDQWFFQFNEALLLTVQMFQRLHAALNDKMPPPGRL